MNYKIKATVYSKRGVVLAEAYNNYTKSHPRQAALAKRVGHECKIYLHAEVAAIIKAQKKGIPYKIKVERYTKKGKPALAKPCDICMMAIKEANIKFLEYSIGE